MSAQNRLLGVLRSSCSSECSAVETLTGSLTRSRRDPLWGIIPASGSCLESEQEVFSQGRSSTELRHRPSKSQDSAR